MSTARPDDALDPVGVETPDDLVTRRAELVGLLQSDESYEDTLQRLADLACETIPGCSAGSVTLWREGEPYTVVSTDELAREVDHAQYDSGEGPCLDAGRYGETHAVADLAAERRWPAFTAVASRHGLRSSLSLPLTVRGRSIGALNLYSRDPDGFTDGVETGRVFAGHAGVAIANAELYDTTRRLVEQLQEALESRAVIEQAKGVLMAEQGCGPKEAFELLRLASQRENVKLREIAHRIVATQAARKR